MTARARMFRLFRDSRGATIAEFALILPTLCVLLMGTFELGWRMYASSVVQGTLHEAARMGTVGNKTTTEVDEYVRERLLTFSRNGTIKTDVRSYEDFTHVATPERITSDSVPTGEFNLGDCYEDFNDNNQYDLDRGKIGLGNADDIVRYEVTLSYPRMFPVAGLMGWDELATIKSSTVLRNQPFGSRTNVTPQVRCTAAAA